MIYFTAHTFKCVCHCIRTMFRVLGMYNFAMISNTTKFQVSLFSTEILIEKGMLLQI